MSTEATERPEHDHNEERVASWVAALGIEPKHRTLDEELALVAKRQPTIHPARHEEERIDWAKLPRRYHPGSLSEALDPIYRNTLRMAVREREYNQPLTEWEREEQRRAEACPTCKGAGMVAAGVQGDYHTLYRPCPTCEHITRQAARARLNRRWPISEWEQQLAASPWLEHRPNAPAEPGRPPEEYPAAPGAIAARAAQREFLRDLISSRTLFLYGPAGVGKTRLTLEVVVVARERGLSSIYRSAERLRTILQDFPRDGDDDAERTRKERRLAVAWEDLTTADVVAIDELDHARGPAILEKVFELTNHRISAGLTTAFAANDVEKLRAAHEPLVDRLLAANNLHVDLSRDESARPWLGHGAL